MTTDELLQIVQPGDALLYRGGGFISWVIRTKTWSPVSHIEVYIGDGKVVSARANGSHIFDLTAHDLYEIWRPVTDTPIDVPAAMRWFHELSEGQRYDLWGLLRFFTLGKQSTDKQFCSELATRWYRAGGFHPFCDQIDADLVAPGTFRYSPHMTRVWAKG